REVNAGLLAGMDPERDAADLHGLGQVESAPRAAAVAGAEEASQPPAVGDRHVDVVARTDSQLDVHGGGPEQAVDRRVADLSPGRAGVVATEDAPGADVGVEASRSGGVAGQGEGNARRQARSGRSGKGAPSRAGVDRTEDAAVVRRHHDDAAAGGDAADVEPPEDQSAERGPSGAAVGAPQHADEGASHSVQATEAAG